MASLIVKSAVRQLALDVAKKRFQSIPGYGKERVSNAFLQRGETMLRGIVTTRINAAIDQAMQELELEFLAAVAHVVNTEPASGKTL